MRGNRSRKRACKMVAVASGKWQVKVAWQWQNSNRIQNVQHICVVPSTYLRCADLDVEHTRRMPRVHAFE